MRCQAYAPRWAVAGAPQNVMWIWRRAAGGPHAVVCWPGLDPCATLLELSFGPAAWGVSSLLPLNASQRTAPVDTDTLELSVETARILELAEREALLMGYPLDQRSCC